MNVVCWLQHLVLTLQMPREGLHEIEGEVRMSGCSKGNPVGVFSHALAPRDIL